MVIIQFNLGQSLGGALHLTLAVYYPLLQNVRSFLIQPTNYMKLSSSGVNVRA
jgi:hypothetical protein